MNKKKKHTTPEERLELWADLVKDVADQLPVSTKASFIAMCLDAFDNNGYDDEYENTFFLSHTYASGHWRKIINEAATGNDGVFVDYTWPTRQWVKLNKRDYVNAKQSEAKGLKTRIESYTYNVETARKRWQLELPGFEVKQLPSGK